MDYGKIFELYVEYLRETSGIVRATPKDLYLFAKLYNKIKGNGELPPRRTLWEKFKTYLMLNCKRVVEKKGKTHYVLCE